MSSDMDYKLNIFKLINRYKELTQGMKLYTANFSQFFLF